MAHSAVATDNFNRADGGLGANWTNYSGNGFGTPTITSNTVNSGADDTDAPAYWSGAGSFNNDQYSQAVINFGQAGGRGANRSYAGVIVRATSTSLIQGQKNADTGATEIYEVTNITTSPAYNQIASVATEIASGSLVLVEVIGTTVSIYDDGVLVTSGTTSITTGKPGILANDNTDQVDNWEGGNFTSAAPPPQHVLGRIFRVK